MIRRVACGMCAAAALWLAGCGRAEPAQFNVVAVTVVSAEETTLHEAETPVENPAAFEALVDGAVEKLGEGTLIHAMHRFRLERDGGKASGGRYVFAMRITQLEGGTWVAVDVKRQFELLEKGDIALTGPTLDALKSQVRAAMLQTFTRPHEFQVWGDE